MAPIADQLTDGMRVMIYMPDEFEMEAVLKFDAEWDAWTADGDLSTIRYLTPKG